MDVSPEENLEGGWENGNRNDWPEQGIVKIVKIDRHDGV